MATKKPVSKNQAAIDSTTDTTTIDVVEQRLTAFAEQLGTLVGTVQAKTDGWLDREALGKQLTDIRDRASDLLGQVNPTALRRVAANAKAKATASPRAKATSATKPGRGLVDAPGKRHRKPPPQTKVGKRAAEPKARVIGNPGLKTGRRGARS